MYLYHLIVTIVKVKLNIYFTNNNTNPRLNYDLLLSISVTYP